MTPTEWNTHPSHDEIERYVVGLSLLGRDAFDRVADHLVDCAACRSAGRDIAAFYDAAQARPSPEDIAAADALASRVLDADEDVHPRVIALRPQVRHPGVTGASAGIIVLAAQDAARQPHYTGVGTLVSEDGRTLLRIVRDNIRGRHVLQVHADKPSLTRYVVVTFDAIPGLFVTDAFGEAVIESWSGTAFDALHGFVHVPVETFQFGTQDRFSLTTHGTAHLTGEGGNALSATKRGDRCTVQFEARNAAATLRLGAVILAGEQAQILYRFVESRAEISAVDLERTDTINVF